MAPACLWHGPSLLRPPCERSARSPGANGPEVASNVTRLARSSCTSMASSSRPPCDSGRTGWTPFTSRLHATIARSSVAARPHSTVNAQQPAMVWFKHDLRVDDHPGLCECGESAPMLAVFCYDPEVYAHTVLDGAAHGAQALATALQRLTRDLADRGVQLLVTSGSWQEVIPDLAAAAGVRRVLAEDEVESGARARVQAVAARLPAGTQLHTWTAPLRAGYSDTHADGADSQGAAAAPLDPPAQLLGVQPPAVQTAVPLSAKEMERLAVLAVGAQLHPSLQSWWKERASVTLGHDEGASGPALPLDSQGALDALDARRSDLEEGAGAPHLGAATSLPAPGRANGADTGIAPRGASPAASRTPRDAGLWTQDGVAAYLRLGLQGDSEESGAELASLVEQHSRPAHPSGCFPAIFSRALTLGALSRRRVAAQARAVLADQAAAGRQGLWRLRRQNRTAKAHVALAAVEASDFHLEMARAREGREVHGARLGHWRWRGTLTDYLVAGDPTAPAILLVHGFGAFGEHWRGNVAALARAGYAVYAPTLPGYGRSEKQALPYGQDLWTSFLCEFVVHVVRQPVTVVGNSIGGFVAASLAGDHPSLVHGLVLVNSAGKVEPGYVAPEKTYSDVAQSGSPLLSPTLINLVSSGLFGLLKGNVKRQLKQLYPSAPERADAWLAAEIVRAATDPGSKGVFTSVFYLQKPRPLNHLVAEMYGGPVLVLQGVRDTLSDTRKRARALAAACSNVQVVMLEAGHCPHDEVPEEFNARLLEWMEGLEPAGTARAGALPAII
ncbi:hypothetical protein ACKKBG_A13810 [Auxenochlorella protothecoides x Auxenochlorella symbiontica]